MADAAVSARGLTRRFGKVRAVDGLDLDARPGEILGLIGPDGAGKTTTMRMLVGAIGIDEGAAFVGGIDVAADPEAARRLLGYMPQWFSLYTDLTVEENMKFFADLYGVTGVEFQKRREELLNFSRLGPHGDKLAGSLSGGMQKKLALSCNLFHKPRVLLLDEPTNGVDPVSRRELWGLLYDLLAGGTTIVVSTPYMDEAERCGRVALMHEGKILVCDRPSELSKKMDCAIVAVSCEREQEVAEALRELPDLMAAYPFHGLLHALFADGARGVEAVRDLAGRKGFALRSVEIVAPSFEDVFIRLIEQKEGRVK